MKRSIRGEVDPMLLFVICVCIGFVVLLVITSEHQTHINRSRELHAEAKHAKTDNDGLMAIVLAGGASQQQVAAQQATATRAASAESAAESYDAEEGVSPAEATAVSSGQSSGASSSVESSGESFGAESSGAESAGESSGE